MKYFIAGLCSLVLFGGCLKDSCINTFTIYYPVFKSLAEVRSDMKSAAPEAINQTGKIYLYKNFIFLNEYGRGVHIIDNADPASPVNLSFLPIPGNIDIAVKDDYLYADCYSDLAVFNISDISAIAPVTFVNSVFPGRGYYTNIASPDSIQVIVDYIARDTVVQCDTYNTWVYNNCDRCATADGTRFYTTASYSGSGTGGSMAAFTILNNFLYTIYYNSLYGFDLANAADPLLKDTTALAVSAETIYPFQQNLFIGTPSGMFIYDVSNPSNPAALGQFEHARSCDPVIADDDNAYVTLRSGSACAGFTNQLDVLSIGNLLSPTLIRSYQMSNPHGLSKDGQWLFICDGTDGLKIFNAADPANVQLHKHIEGLETYDVITNDGIALVVAKDGLYQFDYSNIDDIKQVSKISIQHN